MRARELIAERLAAAFPEYEPREGQLEMADAIETALGEERILLCEAGTGTGKTLAYLVPAILSGKRVVISTATRTLQEQIALRDLPLIERALGLRPHAVVMKGLANYLCLRRFEEYRRGGGLQSELGRGRALPLLEAWKERTRTGEVSELSELAEDDPIWREVTSSSDTRVGAGCRWFDECFVTRMKRDAESAELIIVNHHLFFADLALRGPHPAHVIPDYDAVIFDEAHQLEDIATDFFGVRISSARIEAVLRDLERTLRLLAPGDSVLSGSGFEGPIQAARRAADGFWIRLAMDARAAGGGEGRVAVERDLWNGELERRWHELDSALEAVTALAESAKGRLTAGRAQGSLFVEQAALVDALDTARGRTGGLRDGLATAIEGAPGRVTWLDASPRAQVLSSSPVDVSAIFRENVFERVPAVVLTSATLATGQGSEKPFAYLRSRLGLADSGLDVTERLIASPFDFPENALFYTPRDLPAPNTGEFLSAALERIEQLVALTGGGAFVLTTSNRSLRGFGEALKRRRAGVLMQGEAPKSALLERFRAEGDGVLVATQSFWEGVDIPGRALRLVVLEKVPFAVPSDPIVRARAARIDEEGKSSFNELMVPAAAIALKQGFGRLIRTKSDRGIVALLDERVHRKGYGRRLFAALPPARRTDDWPAVERFWAAGSC
jgi:ATP-dependent DNA helicase DinG